MNRFGFFDPFVKSSSGGGGGTAKEIVSIDKTGSSDGVDTYTITYDDGTTLNFYIDNDNEVEITNNGVQPTDGSVELWVDLKGRTVLTIPEIKDNSITSNDTWSSEKIYNELQDKMPNNIKYAVDIAMELNNQTYVLTTQLKDQDGNNIGHERVINLPMDSMVV